MGKHAKKMAYRGSTSDPCAIVVMVHGTLAVGVRVGVRLRRVGEGAWERGGGRREVDLQLKMAFFYVGIWFGVLEGQHINDPYSLI